MDILTLIIALSAIMWFLIDRFKPLWSEKSWGKGVTLAVSALAGFGLVFAFNLDIIFACGLVENISITGQIITGFVLMSGSSAVAEIIERVKGGNTLE